MCCLLTQWMLHLFALFITSRVIQNASMQVLILFRTCSGRWPVGKINRSQIGPIDQGLLSILMYYIGSLQPYVYMYIKKISIHIIKQKSTNEKKSSAAIYKGREKTSACATYPKIVWVVYRRSTFEPYQDKSQLI